VLIKKHFSPAGEKAKKALLCSPVWAVECFSTQPATSFLLKNKHRRTSENVLQQIVCKISTVYNNFNAVVVQGIYFIAKQI
jgi:hypothetical protein